MSIAALVIACIGAALSTVLVLWLFVWAARKDGEDERAFRSRFRRGPL